MTGEWNWLGIIGYVFNGNEAPEYSAIIIIIIIIISVSIIIIVIII